MIRRWQDITPADAGGLDLSQDLTITAPLTMDGQRCPWPWEPQQLIGVPMGQYHCGYCGEMVVAGVEHPDYAGFDDDYARWCRAVPSCDAAAGVHVTPHRGCVLRDVGQ